MNIMRFYIFGFILLLLPFAAQADTVLQNVYAYEREQYAPEDIHVRSFKVIPSLNVSIMSDDNIFAQETNTVDDVITVVRPQVVIRSDWSKHDLALNIGVNSAHYADNSGENYTDKYLILSGGMDVLRESVVSAQLRYAQKHEDRSEADNVLSLDSVEYAETNLSLNGTHKFNRATVVLNLDTLKIDYDDATSLLGAAINNDVRDRVEHTAKARLSYEMNSSYNAFVQAGYTSVNYDDDTSNRSSRGYDVAVGTVMALSGQTKAEVFAGTQQRNYSNAAVQDTENAYFGGDLFWSVSGLTSVEAGLERKIEETTFVGSSGVTSTAADIDIQHELRRNLLLSLKASFTKDDYESLATPREDGIMGASLEGKYLLNKHLQAILRYNYFERDSTLAGASYENQKVLLNARYVR